MFWPTPQDYNEALQMPRACFSDPDLKHGEVETNAIGLPRSRTGAFASVYKVTTSTGAWAVRCFLSPTSDQKERYRHISEFVLFDNLPSTIDFHYLDQGVFVKGQWFPCLKMTWADGPTLDLFLLENHKKPGKMTRLLQAFNQLSGELETAGIAHGDLQHGNIIVTDEGLRLVDYDALYVPALDGHPSLELGHPNYQHPGRASYHFDKEVDNFSSWLIQVSLQMVSIDPQLFTILKGGDDCILFRRGDLVNPETSETFKVLLEHPSEDIKNHARLLMRMLWAQPDAVPPLDAPPEVLASLPESRSSFSVEERQTSEGSAFLPVPGKSGTARRLSPAELFLRLWRRDILSLYDRASTAMLLRMMPAVWIGKTKTEATKFFRKGDYDRAIALYLSIYKQVKDRELAKSNDLLETLFQLGYCFALAGKSSLSSNYFLLALNESKLLVDTYRHSEEKADVLNWQLRSAFLLALTKFENGEEQSSFKVLDEEIQRSMSDIVRSEMNVYFAKPASYKMLNDFAHFVLKNDKGDWKCFEALKSAQVVWTYLPDKTSFGQKPEDELKFARKLAYKRYSTSFQQVLDGIASVVDPEQLHELAVYQGREQLYESLKLTADVLVKTYGDRELCPLLMRLNKEQMYTAVDALSRNLSGPTGYLAIKELIDRNSERTLVQIIRGIASSRGNILDSWIPLLQNTFPNEKLNGTFEATIRQCNKVIHSTADRVDPSEPWSKMAMDCLEEIMDEFNTIDHLLGHMHSLQWHGKIDTLVKPGERLDSLALRGLEELASRKENTKIIRLVTALNSYGRQDLLNKAFLSLAKANNINFIEDLAQRITSTEESYVVLSKIALELAKREQAEGVKVLAWNITGRGNTHSLLLLIQGLAKIDRGLTETVISQLARGNQWEKIHEVAVALTRAKDFKALKMVRVSLPGTEPAKLRNDLENMLIHASRSSD